MNDDDEESERLPPRVLDAPAAIWLVCGDVADDVEFAHYDRGEVCWSEHQQFEADVRYVRADLAAQTEQAWISRGIKIGIAIAEEEATALDAKLTAYVRAKAVPPLPSPPRRKQARVEYKIRSRRNSENRTGYAKSIREALEAVHWKPADDLRWRCLAVDTSDGTIICESRYHDGVAEAETEIREELAHFNYDLEASP